MQIQECRQLVEVEGANSMLNGARNRFEERGSKMRNLKETQLWSGGWVRNWGARPGPPGDVPVQITEDYPAQIMHENIPFLIYSQQYQS